MANSKTKIIDNRNSTQNYIVVIVMYALTELGYVLICHVKEKRKKNVVLKMLL